MLQSSQQATEPVTGALTRVPGISVVVPVYNSEGSLRPLVERLAKVLPELADQFEVLLINDASRDRSWDKVVELAEAYPFVRGICMMRNYGQHNALLCGIRQAAYAITVTMDDDLQHPPEEIRQLLQHLCEGYDVVYGSPRHEKHTLWRAVASRITKVVLQRGMGASTADKVSAFRIFNTDVRRAFDTYRSPYVSIDALLTWGTNRFSALPVRHDARTIGVSNYTFGKLLVHALNMITAFSTFPLQVASSIGFAATVVGLGLCGAIVYQYTVHGDVVPGFPFLASVVITTAGAQLFCLGIIGEYLARMHHRLMDRPVYTVRATTASAPPSQ